MPFTLSHAAAAIPFRRTPLIPSAVVVGCFAPDFEYFIRLAPSGGFGHTLSGIFILDLPLGLLMLWLFHAYAKYPLWSWLPKRMRDKIPAESTRLPVNSAAEFMLLLLSIVIGAGTHIAWDSFTHPWLWPYEHWDLLRRTVSVPLIGRVPCYKIFQHASTMLGLFVIALWAMRWLRHAAAKPRAHAEQAGTNGRAFLAVALAIAMFAALLRASIGAGFPWGQHDRNLFWVEALVTSITTFWLEVVFYGIYSAGHGNRVKTG